MINCLQSVYTGLSLDYKVCTQGMDTYLNLIQYALWQLSIWYYDYQHTLIVSTSELASSSIVLLIHRVILNNNRDPLCYTYLNTVQRGYIAEETLRLYKDKNKCCLKINLFWWFDIYIHIIQFNLMFIFEYYIVLL